MIRDWFVGSRSWVTTAVSLGAIGALIATVAVTSSGYTAQRLDLNDASVWVANSQERVIGRVNTEVRELNTVVGAADGAATAATLEVVQQGAAVYLLDRSINAVDVIDAATSSVVDSTPLPAGEPELFPAGENLVIHLPDTGAVWVIAGADIATFDAASEPTMNLGGGSTIAVSTAGTVYGFSGTAQALYLLDASRLGSAAQSIDLDTPGTSEDFSLTVVGERWALLDEDAGILHTADMQTNLADLGDGSTPRLQQPSGPADAVLLATRDGLHSVPFDGGEPRTLADGRTGQPAAPVRVAECTFAAWTDGTAWRQCDPGEGQYLPLSGMAGTAPLVFAINGTRTVLSEPQTGSTWAVQASGERIDNWDALITDEEDRQQVRHADDDEPVELDRTQRPPVAEDDEFGARPGRATVLPVLLNDYDLNGDALAIDEVTPVDEAVGRVDLVANRQQVQLTLTPEAAGSVQFTYTISDGRGGTATATVTVTIRTPLENSPPYQARPTAATVAQDGRLQLPVLGDWVDPDGDAIYLAAAAATEPDTVTYQPQGTVIFQDGAGELTRRTVGLTVSDGTASGFGVLSVTVRPSGEVPIVAEPFVVLGHVDEELTISPLEHVRGGTGTLRLGGTPTASGATITPGAAAGTFRIRSDQARTHNVEYSVTDGDQSVTGFVRVELRPRPNAGAKPITTPKTVFVKTLSSELVDVAARDIDPAGGVLMVTGLTVHDAGSGVRAEVLEQRSVRVTLTAPLENGPVTLGYRISNGLAEADGTITVVEIAHPERLQAPLAVDDQATVRVGDVIDIPVLGNDSHPDGEELTLDPQLVTGLDSSAGLLFASGNTLRYLAPQRTGNFTAVYQVRGPDGQIAQAQVRIAVREAEPSSNRAPTPQTVIARVVAGQTTGIRIPLAGIDPDGDSVQLLGQETNPEKGAVSVIDSDLIEYRAGDYSAGTDTFQYTVMDALGARATGTVMVGISPQGEWAGRPVANEDEVQARPGATVSVNVLANDTDPSGSELHVVRVEPNSPDIGYELRDDILHITPPAVAGRYGLVYTIENAAGATSSNFVTVVVTPDAPRAYPVISDSVLTLSDILDRELVTVPVLENAFFADGLPQELDVRLLPGYGQTARVTGDKRIEVTVAEEAQIIPFAVHHPEDDTVVSYAFVWLPGYEDALPQLDYRADPLVVESESRLTIDLDEYVVAIGNDGVRLTDSTTVQATHSNGDDLVVDEKTLRFTSADKYFGPASISFEVTDGQTADDPDGRTATLVLPITVTPRENQPPVFTGGVIEFEPGEEKTLDLLRLTTYPYPDDMDELAYTLLGQPPAGFSYTLAESSLTLRADEATAKGSTTSLTLGVRDDLSEGRAGRLQLDVVASTRPLARPAADSVIVPRGKTTVVDVLANDEATNPFPGRPLRVTSIRGLDGGDLPAGLSVTTSADRSRLSVTVGPAAQPVDTRLQYQVTDATGDADRRVWGTVTLSVQDVPERPVAPTRAGWDFASGTLTLGISAPAANNSPITRYEITGTGGYQRDCGLQLRCVLNDLTPGAAYEFRVIAVNALGPSEPSPASAILRADYLPAAVTGVTATATTADPAISVNWNRVPDPTPGTTVTGYTVHISGHGVDERIQVGAGATQLTNATVGGALVAGRDYSVVVYARNSAPAADAEWNRHVPVVVTAVGKPLPADAVSAVVTDDGIRVTWTTPPGQWNGAAGGTYAIGRIPASQPAPTDCNPRVGIGNGTTNATSGWVDGTASGDTPYRYVVYSDNGLECTPATSAPVEIKNAPGMTSATASVQARGSTGQFDVRVDALSAAGVVGEYHYRLSPGSPWQTVTTGQWLTSLAQTQAAYGNPQQLQFRVCRDSTEDYCSDPTAPTEVTPINARAGIVSCAIGTAPVLAAPLNGGSPSISYLYAFNPDLGDPAGWGEFTGDATVPPSTVPGEPTGVRVKAVVQFGGTDYVDPGFAEGSCE